MYKIVKYTAISFSALAIMSGLTSCRLMRTLSDVGEQPPLTPIENPEKTPGYKPVTMPMPQQRQAQGQPNSLWQQGAKGFFKDQRASQIGDILTVLITISDSATTSNVTTRKRDNTEDLDVKSLFGKEKRLGKYIGTSAATGSKALDIISKPDESGTGTITRSETVSLKVAAIVTQVLPNGNFVIEGRQEVLINFERRDLYIRGIIRPEDISSDNTIAHEKIAEARVNYGGEGQLMQFQQPPWGTQIVDAITPF